MVEKLPNPLNVKSLRSATETGTRREEMTEIRFVHLPQLLKVMGLSPFAIAGTESKEMAEKVFVQMGR